MSDLFSVQLRELTAETTEWREPPWILEFRLLHNRPGKIEEARFRHIQEVPIVWSKNKTPESWIMREDVEMDFLIEVKLRRRNTGAGLKILEVITDMISQKWAGESPWRWYTIRDMLEAGERLAGVREKLRKKHPPDLCGFMHIPADLSGRTELTLPLITLEKWANDMPDMHREHEKYQEFIKKKGDQAGEIKFTARRYAE